MASGKLRPSPAIVLAAVALVMAVAGTAIAGPGALERALTKAKVKEIAEKQADSRITQRAPGLTVASADPVAFAHVLANGTIDAANSKAITQGNISNGTTPGYYCFDNLPFQPRGGAATVDWNTATGSIDTIVLVGLGSNPECPVGTDFFVDTRNAPDGTGSSPTAFFLTLYR